MIRFTSEESINRYGADSIINYYKSMDFGYEMKLKSFNRSNNRYQLNYWAKINATEVIIRMNVVVDNADSAKVVLPEKFYLQQVFLFK